MHFYNAFLCGAPVGSFPPGFFFADFPINNALLLHALYTQTQIIYALSYYFVAFNSYTYMLIIRTNGLGNKMFNKQIDFKELETVFGQAVIDQVTVGYREEWAVV